MSLFLFRSECNSFGETYILRKSYIKYHKEVFKREKEKLLLRVL